VKLIECVPNFSEGRDPGIIEAIRARIAAVPGVSVLHVTSDAWHNRSVITFVADASIMPDAAVAAIRAARDNIDLTRHAGVHPRIGAADVVPFIPLEGATMDDCVAIAREVGKRVGNDLAIPVYLYHDAATGPSRHKLADVRRGGFEALREAIVADPDRSPDFGPARLHPTAGAVAIGARPFLIAFNCYIGDASSIAAARSIARTIREANGGLPGLRALGLEVDGQAQVSMNITDIERASLLDAYGAVSREAGALGLSVTWSEIIGLVPERSVLELASRVLKLRDDIADHVLERRLLATRSSLSLPSYVNDVGSASPFPGGGSVAAITAALAAALVRMVAGLTLGRERFVTVHDEMLTIAQRAGSLAASLQELAQRDSTAYASVVDARKLPGESPPEVTHRATAVDAALLAAAEVPLDVCRVCAEVAKLALATAERGNPNALTDAGVAAALASAACLGASYNVRVNVRDMTPSGDGPSAAEALIEEAKALTATTRKTADHVIRLVEGSLGT
jgi:glutamate formiminotransferase/formiminotetrahydrofolate cyclodeaminase